MSWVKIDDGFPFHRKAILAGKDGRALYITALCWSSGQLTDGVIDAAVVPMLCSISDVANAEATAKQLVKVGLWEIVDGDYVIHDYHDYNPDACKVKAIREARAKAGRRGGIASGSKRQAKDEANATTNEEQNRTPSPSPMKDTDKGADAPPASPVTFEQWLEALKSPQSIGETNGIAVLQRMGAQLYPHWPPDGYARIGKLAKTAGSQSKLAAIFWENASKPLAAPLDYLTAAVNGKRKDDGPPHPPQQFDTLGGPQ